MPIVIQRIIILYCIRGNDTVGRITFSKSSETIVCQDLVACHIDSEWDCKRRA